MDCEYFTYDINLLLLKIYRNNIFTVVVFAL